MKILGAFMLVELQWLDQQGRLKLKVLLIFLLLTLDLSSFREVRLFKSWSFFG